jgi:hypothetical protein
VSCFKSVAILFLFLGVAGCGNLPRPFKAELGRGAESPLVALQDTAGVVVIPIGGAPPGVGGPLADILAAELRRADVPATSASAIKDGYLLEGEANFAPKGEGPGEISVDWTISDSRGNIVEHFVTRQTANEAAWRAGSRIVLNRFVADAVPRIAGVLRSSLPTVADPGRPTIGVVVIEGAPGDGNEALKSAFEAVLGNAGLPVVLDAKSAAIQVFGRVVVAPDGKGRDNIEIEWILRRPDGSEIGSMKQTNAIGAGKAAVRWGPLAYDVTFAMVESIADVLQTMERADDIRQGR